MHPWASPETPHHLWPFLLSLRLSPPRFRPPSSVHGPLPALIPSRLTPRPQVRTTPVSPPAAWSWVPGRCVQRPVHVSTWVSWAETDSAARPQRRPSVSPLAARPSRAHGVGAALGQHLSASKAAAARSPALSLPESTSRPPRGVEPHMAWARGLSDHVVRAQSSPAMPAPAVPQPLLKASAPAVPRAWDHTPLTSSPCVMAVPPPPAFLSPGLTFAQGGVSVSWCLCPSRQRVAPQGGHVCWFFFLSIQRHSQNSAWHLGVWGAQRGPASESGCEIIQSIRQGLRWDLPGRVYNVGQEILPERDSNKLTFVMSIRSLKQGLPWWRSG